MSLTDYGVLVVYGSGDQYFNDPWAALRFAAYMECMGHDCLFYLAEIVESGHKVLERLSRADMDELCLLHREAGKKTAFVKWPVDERRLMDAFRRALKHTEEARGNGN